MTLAENYLIWKAPKNLVLDSGFEPQIIADLRLRIQEFTRQGSAGASWGLAHPTSVINPIVAIQRIAKMLRCNLLEGSNVGFIFSRDHQCLAK